MWNNKNEVSLKPLKKIISKQKLFCIMKYFIKYLCYSNSWKFLTFSFKQVFPALLSFSRSIAKMANVFDRSKCISLNNQSCMTRPAFIDLYPH